MQRNENLGYFAVIFSDSTAVLIARHLGGIFPTTSHRYGGFGLLAMQLGKNGRLAKSVFQSLTSRVPD